MSSAMTLILPLRWLRLRLFFVLATSILLKEKLMWHRYIEGPIVPPLLISCVEYITKMLKVRDVLLYCIAIDVWLD